LRQLRILQRQLPSLQPLASESAPTALVPALLLEEVVGHLELLLHFADLLLLLLNRAGHLAHVELCLLLAQVLRFKVKKAAAIFRSLPSLSLYFSAIRCLSRFLEPAFNKMN